MKNKINCYFRNLTPIRSDDEVLYRVLRKAEEMQKNEAKKKISLKKPIIAICAIIGALTVGVTGAAAAGIINFNEIFDKRIAVQNKELGEKLLCNTENFNYSISDEAYQIEMQGLIGTEHEIMGTLIISRKDGKPVTDYIKAVDISEKIFMDKVTSEVHPSEKYKDYCFYSSTFCNYYTDNNGNIKIELTMSCYQNMYNNKVHIGAERNYKQLPFDWSVEFDYIPSKTAVERLYRGYFTVEDKVPVIYWIPDEEIQNQCKAVETMGDIDYIELSSIDGTIEGKAKLPEEWIYKAAGQELIAINKFKVFLNKKDGSTVYAFLESGEYSQNKFSLNLRYINRDINELIENETLFDNYIAVDLSEIKSITINGKTFDMQ